jgi:hypothetical protein
METAEAEEFYLFEPDEIEEIIDKSRSALIELAAVQVKKGAPLSAFRLPPPFKSDYRWIAPGESVTIGKYTINAGLFYFGTNMRLVNGAQAAALIDPSLPFPHKYKNAPHGGKIPEEYDYACLSPLQRREYLAWLAGGRSDPEANGWTIMLFLTGLERRVIEDGRRGLVTLEELRLIRDEAARLLALYGDKNDTPAFTLTRFFQFLELNLFERKLYTLPVPPEKPGAEASVYLTTLINQCAEDKQALSAEVVFAWFICHPVVKNNFLVLYCFNEYKALFLEYFNQTYKDKVFVTQEKEKCVIKTCYIPLSDQVRANEIEMPCALHKIASTAVTSAAQDINDRCVKDLSAYARYLTLGERDKWRERFIKPFIFWDDELKLRADGLKNYIEEKESVVCEAGWLIQRIDENAPFSTELAEDIIRGLEYIGISGTLDALLALDQEVDEDTVFTLYTFPGPVAHTSYNEFRLQMKTMRLIAVAAKECIPNEYPMYYPGCLCSVPLNAYQRTKAANAFFMLCGKPVAYKDAVKPFIRAPSDVKYALIRLITRFFDAYRNEYQYDTGYTGIAFLEKLYTSLKIDKAELYSRLHKDAAGEEAKPDSAAFSLDEEKIKKLRSDTDDVSELLSAVFVDSTAPAQLPAERAASLSSHSTSTSPEPLLGLSGRHCLFIEKLAEKARWTREEAADLADTSGLILNGALEILNEAAFEEYEDMFIYEEDGDIVLNETIRDGIIQEMESAKKQNKRKSKRRK